MKIHLKLDPPATFPCPYCHVTVKPEFHAFELGEDPKDGHFAVDVTRCPHCDRLLARRRYMKMNPHSVLVNVSFGWLVPSGAQRTAPPAVTAEFKTDFEEAAAVLSISSKASAALSRRLLQHIIREKAGIRKRNLDDEIQALIDANVLPPDLAHDLDAVRTLGNFAAHPIKSTETGAVVEVEPGEAEWLLDLIDELFEFYFVRPAIRAKRRASLDAKLEDAGKPPLRGSDATSGSADQLP